MLDRFGKSIFVGFAEHEILWIKAAMSFKPRSRARVDAFREISELTGRSVDSIRQKAHMIEGARLDALAAERSRTITVPARDMRQARGIERPRHSTRSYASLGPSSITVDLRQAMGRRA